MKKYAIIVGGIVIIAFIFFVFINKEKEVKLPDNLISVEEATSAIKEALSKDEGYYLAYLWPEILKPGDTVKTWDEESATTTIKEFSYLAWVDTQPGNAFFAHPTKFIYVNAETGSINEEDKDFWPVVNGESFEGDDSTLIAIAGERVAINESLRKSVGDYMKKQLSKVSIPQVSAQSANRLRIDPDAANAPTGNYYAIVVAGYGRNAWVFMEGANEMNDALRRAGYDDDKITFLAQGPARLDPTWDRTGTPGLIRNDLVDGYTSPTNLNRAITDIREETTRIDSLFVFMLVHGRDGRFAMGKIAASANRNNIDRALQGRSANMSSRRFANLLVGRTNELCELMILVDSCYSGSHEDRLRREYDPEKIKRMQVGLSTSDETLSYGADFRDPSLESGEPAEKDLDNGAPETPTVDTNPGDHGGEFSSGFIANINQTIFGTIYESGIALDAAQLNDLTEPSIFMLGELGPCVAPVPAGIDDRPKGAIIEKEEVIKEEDKSALAPTETSTDTSFAHVKPGEYSEIYFFVNTASGASVEVTLTGPGVDDQATKTATADGEGRAQITWKIVAYGSYTITGSANGTDILDIVVVE